MFGCVFKTVIKNHRSVYAVENLTEPHRRVKCCTYIYVKHVLMLDTGRSSQCMSVEFHAFHISYQERSSENIDISINIIA